MTNSVNGNPPSPARAAAAQADTETTLIQIWSEVLNTENIGIQDGFLDSGGDSLAAMRCINRISATFGVDLPLDLFLLESAHIAQVASEIGRMQLDSSQTIALENA
jgi:yersiniabactin nonribosomal peptide synthetase